MTSLPLARVNSPDCDAITLRFGLALMTSANPFFRSIAGAAPTVPSSWTMFTVSSESLYSSTSHWPAFLPSSTKSEPRKVTYMDGSESTARSVSTTGMPAAFASLRTASQPVTTTGENAMTSTFCLMKERIAAIWFSCFCCASANLRSMPAAAASSLIDLVFAVRQPLSAPTWENPRVILSDPERNRNRNRSRRRRPGTPGRAPRPRRRRGFFASSGVLLRGGGALC